MRAGDLLLLARYPGEPPLPTGSAVESIRVSHPPAVLRMGGFAINWLALFCLLSLGSGLLFRSVFGPEI